ncbi:DUF5689 domain-containing protein [Spongiimicrobium salis]|uniref:DUF5689 domain-containing protein n=1 Tax=Spongiimicrobium salis TaxID=1667022 RepID=UPI00374CFFC6
MKIRSFLYARKLGLVPLLLLCLCCVEDVNFDPLSMECQNSLEPTITLSALKALYQGEILQIQEDLVLRAYVISSDEAGNFFGSLHLQDHPEAPGEGIQLEMDFRDSHLFYPPGSTVLIQLKGLYLGKRRGLLTLGGVLSIFGNLSIGRLPRALVQEHLTLACNGDNGITPQVTTLASLNDTMINTLVRLEGMEFKEEEIDFPFALPRENTIRTLRDCTEAEIKLLNSGFSDFQETPLPRGNGSITGILVKDRDDFQLRIRDRSDIQFNEERCPPLIDEFSSEFVFISELADPNNNTGARFVELYNAEKNTLSLKGWTLQRYTNANTEVSAVIDLSNMHIGGENTLVISPNAQEFEQVYGFAPDMEAPGNSPANSNGDDTIVLVDPFGTTIDIFGVIGVDGSGTAHEFEDGRALRKADIVKANPIYNANEWSVYNDSGGAATMNQIQNAPEDFGPGQRE